MNLKKVYVEDEDGVTVALVNEQGHTVALVHPDDAERVLFMLNDDTQGAT